MNHVTSESTQYYEKPPRKTTAILLYSNLLINITYGIIYILLNKIIFPDAATNIAISLASSETVILYFAILTVHDKKSFMLIWVIFIILLNSSLIIITSIIHFFVQYCKSMHSWHRYIGEKLYELQSQFSDIVSPEWEEYFLKYVPMVVMSFIFATLFFKWYSVWAIHRYELKGRLVHSISNLLFGRPELRTCKRVAAPDLRVHVSLGAI